MTNTVRVPLPKLGSGYRVIRGTDGKMTTVPLTGADMALYRPMMAMDHAMPVGGPKGSPNYADYNATDDDPNDVDLDTPDSSGDDLSSKIHQLLEGKIDDASIDMLIKLIEGSDDTDAPVPVASDRRRQARDQRLMMPSRAEILRRIAKSGEVRAARAAKSHETLVARFPALKNARVA